MNHRPSTIDHQPFHRAMAVLFAENHALRSQVQGRLRMDLPGDSRAAGSLRSRVSQAARRSAPVLLRSEPGSGAGRVARCIHLCGPRPQTPFRELDGQGVPSRRLREMLAACGLSSRSRTQSDPAWRSGGTVFLRHVDAVALPLQKLLADALGEDSGRRTVDSGQRPRRASSRSAVHSSPSTVRLIASTRIDPEQAIGETTLRADLLRVLSATVVDLPPLRERRDDLAELVERILQEHTLRTGVPRVGISPEALELLESHAWPGNLRELEHVIVGAAAAHDGVVLTAEAVRPWLMRPGQGRDRETASPSLREMERRLIEAAFARCGGNRERTARCLGIGIRTLSGKLRDYGYPPRGGPGSNRSFIPLLKAG